MHLRYVFITSKSTAIYRRDALFLFREDGMLVALRGLSQRDRSTQAEACHSYELSILTDSKTETNHVTDANYNFSDRQ